MFISVHQLTTPEEEAAAWSLFLRNPGWMRILRHHRSVLFPGGMLHHPLNKIQHPRHYHALAIALPNVDPLSGVGLEFYALGMALSLTEPMVSGAEVLRLLKTVQATGLSDEAKAWLFRNEAAREPTYA